MTNKTFSSKEFFTQYKNLFPLLILVLTCIYSIYLSIVGENENGSQTYSIFSLSDYVGVLLLGPTVAIFFLRREWFSKAVLLTLIFGMLDLANFTHFKSNYWLRIASFPPIVLQPVSLGIGLLYILLNLNRVKLERKEQKQYEEEIRNTFSEEKFLAFQKQYSTLSSNELKAISEDQRFTKEARDAAALLIKNREDN